MKLPATLARAVDAATCAAVTKSVLDGIDTIRNLPATQRTLKAQVHTLEKRIERLERKKKH